jgi:hypothetical protein
MVVTGKRFLARRQRTAHFQGMTAEARQRLFGQTPP